MTTFFLILAIFVAVWLGTSIIGNVLNKQGVHWVILALFALSITAIITHCIGIW